MGGPEVPKTAFNITTSASASQIATSSHQYKSRSSSVDGDTVPQIPGSVITASLKIPMPSNTSGTPFTLSVDDSDIPYIEDSGGGSLDSGHQQMTIGECVNTAFMISEKCY